MQYNQQRLMPHEGSKLSSVLGTVLTVAIVVPANRRRRRCLLNGNLPFMVMALSFLIALGCQPQVSSGNKPQVSSRRKSWPLNQFSSIPADKVTIDSGTTFHWNDIQCTLLGLKESTDPLKRQKAFEFSKKWFKNIHYKQLNFYNYRNPLTTEDGSCVVWLSGDIYPHGSSTLNTELVRAGLVEIENDRWRDYSFTLTWSKAHDGDIEYPWQEKLQEAATGHENGEKLRINFPWP